ncbi:hypothetical protein EFT87_02795 [Schleiferilactobacillus harbinensis]|uniref:hypothetical protein n=1 Tax=Schleiferilactobacillus harbinensis TaxID=304207 RepID=UPI0021A7B9A8|nr:hypothetical protein [Schleiferilactobacillus harbinensis]MCT2907592.1 hypothetical protein [Schleiferilactobacillus harbinensis]
MSKLFATLAIWWLMCVVGVALITMYMATNGNYEGALVFFLPVLILGFPISRYLKRHLLHQRVK